MVRSVNPTMMNRILDTVKPRTHYRLQYASNLLIDLHRKPFNEILRPAPRVEHVALLGNICRPGSLRSWHFLNYCATHWEKVFWILGPHELSNAPGSQKAFYEQTEAIQKMTEDFKDTVILMNHQEYSQPKENLAIVGASLWTPNLRAVAGQPEFTSIYKKGDSQGTPCLMDSATYKDWHEEDKEYLRMRRRYWYSMEPQINLLFLTHHLPSPYMLSHTMSAESYKRISLDVNNMEEYMRPPLRVILSGASGSTASGYLGPDGVEPKVFCAVNSCFEYPLVKKAKQNPGYSPTLYMEMNLQPSKYPPAEASAGSQTAGLPKPVSSLFKPHVPLPAL